MLVSCQTFNEIHYPLPMLANDESYGRLFPKIIGISYLKVPPCKSTHYSRNNPCTYNGQFDPRWCGNSGIPYTMDNVN